MKTKRVGELLREQREKSRITVAQLAQYTKIQAHYIQSIEAGEFERLPPSPFVKGYVRTICVTLGSNPEPVIALLRRDYTEATTGQLLPNTAWRRRRPRLYLGVFGWFMLLVSAVVVVAVGYGGAQWLYAMQPPYLEVLHPEPFSQQSTSIKVVGNTDTDAVVSINGQPAAIKPDGSFVAEIDLPAVGLITLRVEAQDSQARSAVIEVPVRVVSPAE